MTKGTQMDWQTILVWLSFVSLLIGSMIWFACFLLLKFLKPMQTELTQSVTALVTLTDKAMGLLSSKDPMTFQAIQAMGTSSLYPEEDYDPSDRGEFDRLGLESMEEEALNGDEESALAELSRLPNGIF